jgi:REP element-mobilizing transposase RayT
MPRLPRVYVEGAIYYVTCRGGHNEKLFREKKDYGMYIELLEKYRKELKFKLFAYVLLPEHIHLLIEPSPEIGISDIMRSLNTAYSKWFNSAYNRRGHLFRERFKATIAEKESYLLRLTAHMHRNPLRLGLCQEPFGYPYSSYMLYLYKEAPAGYDEIKEVLDYLGKVSYQVYVTASKEEDLELHKRLQRGGVLGSKEFRKKVKEQVEKSRQVLSEQSAGERNFTPMTAVLLVLLAASAGTFVFIRSEERKIPEATDVTKKTIASIQELDILDNTEWELRFVPFDAERPGFTDKVSFIKGRFISARFSQEGFEATGYSSSEEAGALTWETVQASKGAIASWRGEVRDEKMQGVLSLRFQEGTQDFSFISIRFRRRK